MSIFNGNSYSNVNIGTAANSGDGDALRTAFEKTNNNFFDIYTFLGNSTHLGNVTNINIKGGTITGITDLALADGGTGASTATAARTNLGLIIGTNVQAWDSALDVISSVTPAADRIVYYTGASSASGTALTAYARTLLDDTDAASVRTTLGLGNAALLNDGLLVVTDANVTANLTVGNVRILNSIIGNVSIGNISISGRLTTSEATVTGNISASGNASFGNVSATAIVGTRGSFNFANIGNVLLDRGNINAIDRLNAATGYFSGNLVVGGNVNIAGNITVGNIIVSGTTTTVGSQNITGNINVYNVIAENASQPGGSAVVSVQGRFSGNVTAGNITATRGTFTQVDLPATGVASTTYGGTSKVPVFVVGTDGRITSAANVNVAGVTSFSSNNRFFVISTADGSSFTANIPNVSVTADTYGGTTNVPVITIDQQGRITSAANVAVSALTDTGVAAAVYGSSRVIPVINVNAQGRIVTASNVSIGDIVLGSETSGNYIATMLGGLGIGVSGSGSESAIVTLTNTGVVNLSNVSPILANVSTGNVQITHATSGVAASTYGGNDGIGVFTVNSTGHVSYAANVSLNTAFGATTVSNITASNIVASNVNISGNALFRTYSEYVSNVTAAAGTTTIDLNLQDSGVFFCVINSSKTFTFSNPPTNRLGSFSLITFNSFAGNTISWPGTVKWAGGASNIPPRTSNASAIDVWTFFTYDSGTSYIGTLASKDAKA